MDINALRDELHKTIELHNFDYSHPEVVKKAVEFEYKLQNLTQQQPKI